MTELKSKAKADQDRKNEACLIRTRMEENFKEALEIFYHHQKLRNSMQHTNDISVRFRHTVATMKRIRKRIPEEIGVCQKFDCRLQNSMIEQDEIRIPQYGNILSGSQRLYISI
ncbi:hypothetical protein NPIL_144071 [Nephila pilipes]|uniref:Uncharacterized protein n=1 Tax=Nephila pilipes TaxID=299642 RepID=A0A8X6SZT9_NEPPI|nr:hypothetical protein NPIL_144071 [Nephila pilipes]